MRDFNMFFREQPCDPEKLMMVEAAFDREALKRVCEMHETEFASAYGMTSIKVDQEAPADFFNYRCNGSDVLAVAHLDTVGLHHERTARFLDTEGGTVVYSRALDDRLGAYVILELLPALGIRHDILLTTGEECGKSTAGFFEPPKEYNWGIEFDRGGTDVVMYEYEDRQTIELVEAAGVEVGGGSFSDICYIEHLGIKCFNWGVGYQDYHGPRAHAYLDDTFSMIAKYLTFHEDNAGTFLPHVPRPPMWWDYRDKEEERECDRIFGRNHGHDDEGCAEVLREWNSELEGSGSNN